MTLLDIAIKMRKNKPDFVRQDIYKKKRLRKRWVNPRGLHSKVRLKKSGHPRKVQNGYGSPSAVRGLHSSGLSIKLVMNDSDLSKIDKSKQGIIIAGNVGLKNKISLLKKAKEKGIKVLNLDVDNYLKDKEEQLKLRFDKKKKEDKKKSKKETAAAKTEKLEEKLTDEEKKEQEKKEKDKLLTKRDI